MAARTGHLRIPVKISEAYVKPGDEQLLFPNIQNFLRRGEVHDAWPNGVITHEQFTFQGLNWRLHSGRVGGPSSPLQYLAVLDGDASSSMLMSLPSLQTTTERRSTGNPDATTIPLRSPASPCSRPLVDLDLDTSGSPQHMVPAIRTLAAESPSSSAMASSWLVQQSAAQQRQSGLALALAQSQSQNKFIEDLLTAESSHNAMERYKALIRLMSALKRRIAHARVAQPLKPQSWESQEQQDVLKQIVMVGECLARFGTAEFAERSNSSRAINTKDYATLLTQFLDAHGSIFSMEFIAHLPQNLQDEVLTVRSLLQTRCEANNILFAQLVKHVGMEGQGNGQAVVYNTSVVTANPTNITTTATNTLMQVAANAWSKATEKRSTRFGMMGAAALLGLWILKGRLLGGGGRRGGRRRQGDSGDSEFDNMSRGRRGRYGPAGALGLAERLLDMRTISERTAVSHLVACSEELHRAQQNMELLSHDWRMGQLRLGGGTYPPGFHPVDPSRCSLNSYLHRLEDPHWQPAVPQYAPRAYQEVQQLALDRGGGGGAVIDVSCVTLGSREQQQAAPAAIVPALPAPKQRQEKRGSGSNRGSSSSSSNNSNSSQDVAVNAPGNPLEAALAALPSLSSMFLR